jgi:hypothetical protein
MRADRWITAHDTEHHVTVRNRAEASRDQYTAYERVAP